LRVLLVHSGSDLYGASRSLLRLATRLIDDGNQVVAVIPREGPLRKELEHAGVNVDIQTSLSVISREGGVSLLRRLKVLLTVPVSCWHLARVVRTHRPDIVHTNTAMILSPGIVCALHRIPHVWHIRESFQEFSRLFSLYQWYIAGFSDSIVCVSTPIAEQFTGRIQRRKIVVIHNGIPKEEFVNIQAREIENFRRRHGVEGKILVGLVGRVRVGRKGQDVLVRAAALLKTKFPNVRYMIVGSPFPGNEDHLVRVKTLANVLGVGDVIVYTGDETDIKAAISALDISVLASALPEPFAGVVLESMALGKPVIGTRIGGTVEQVVDGLTGFLVDPGSPEALAIALERLLADPHLRSRMGQAGRQRYFEKFEFERFYQRIVLLYKQCSTGGL
jgi:glycosyltransferase involved in cell wall biosynthesis